MKNLVSYGVRNVVKNLMENLGVKKIKLGEALGDSLGEESNQQKYLRAERFLKSNSDIGIDKILKLSQFFDRPVNYFLNPELYLSASGRQVVEGVKPINEIEVGLRKMGLDEAFIKNEIEQLQAMELYKTMKK